MASSFTNSALATLATGTWPAQHGIVADRWYDRDSRAPVSATSEALLAGTLFAQLAGDSRYRTYVIGSNPEQTALFSGDFQARQFWMDEAGRFTTVGETLDWLTSFNNLKPIENVHNAPWMLFDARSGAPPMRRLTFDDAHPAEFLRLYRASPWAEQAQFELLRELIAKEHLGQGETFDIVCLISGAGSLLGHEEGAGSPLVRQMVLHLDRHMEYLLDALKSQPGENAFNLVLAAGHGVPTAPLEVSRERMAVSGESVAQTVNRALVASEGARVSKYIYPFLYLDTTGFRDPEPLRIAAARAALNHPAVAACYTAGGYCTVRDEFETRFRNSFQPLRSGDVMIAYHPGYVEDFGQGRGISYGSLYNYDIRVPLCFYGPQFKAGVFELPVRSVDMAPTLARVLGVGPPDSSVGRVLGEALAE